MSPGHGTRRRETRYFALTSTGGETRIARITGRGVSSWFDQQTSTWVNDPLLGATIRMTDDWVRVQPPELPDGAADEIEPATPTSHRRGWFGRRRTGSQLS